MARAKPSAKDAAQARPGTLGAGRRAAARPASAAAPPLAPGHPAWFVAGLVTAACAIVSVTFPIFDSDVWQHLLVGRAIWETHTIPTRQVWTWPTYGAPDVNASWGFRALIWPFWTIGGEWGLFLWRWLTTLAAFALAFATARRLGARGLSTFVALTLCALTYRQRSQVRPETLVVVLLALQMWFLETRRSAAARAVEGLSGSGSGPDRTLGLIAIAWVWANVHISYHLGFIMLAIHLIDAWLPARRAGAAGTDAPGRGRLLVVALLALAISFVNPFGWRALWQPFQFLLFWRNDPFFKTIGELQPLPWSVNWWNGLPLLVVGWPALQLWRSRWFGFDRVEAMLCVVFTAFALASVRFVGFLAVAAAPYLARDLDAWIATRRWPARTASPWRRAGFAGLACVVLCLPEWTLSDFGFGVRMDWKLYPIRACDFMAEHGVRGRAFNTFSLGGYQLYRFWPERDRLPFVDIHPEEADPEKRRYYVFSAYDPAVWARAQERYRFDYALLARLTFARNQIPDFLDGDPAWALVFIDDAAALFVRRDGPLAPIAERFAYRLVPAGNRRLNALGDACRRDPALRARLAAELAREVRESPWNATANGLLANLAILEGRIPAARDYLTRAVAADPEDRGLRERLRQVEARIGR